jgi:hypothetical protein
MKRSLKIFALCIALSTVLPGCVVAPAPGPGAVWVPGHYGPYGGWVPGHWR